MKLLITPALKLTEEQCEILREKHELFFLDDERNSVDEQQIGFDLKEIEGIVCNFFFVKNSLNVLPNLRYIQLTSAGLDRVPVNEIREKNIELHSIGDVYAIPMSEWAVGKVLEIMKCSRFFSNNQAEKKWEKNRTIRELYQAKATILGFGNVGKNIAKRLKGFEVEITAVDIKKIEENIVDKFYYLDELKKAVEKADAIFITLPLVEETYHLINGEIMDAMKEDAIIINVARGKLIDEEQLIDRMKRGKFCGVALDVFETEPLEKESELWNFERVSVTPHNSFVGNGNQERIFKRVLENLRTMDEI